MITIYDYIVVVFYFAFLIVIGFLTKRFISNTSDYFRAGGKMLWWMVGSSAFLVQFSAWSFTGAAGEAYLNGPIVIIIFLGNAIGFLANYFFFAPKFRQMRVITAMQAVKQRFGTSGEQFFTWVQVPASILNSGVWLMGLSIFVSSVFDIPLEWIIFGVGLTVIINSTLGGAWGVGASDFVQLLVLMMVAIVMAFYSISEVGGVEAMIDRFPVDTLLGDKYNYPAVIIAWAVAMLLSQLFKTNHMLDANRYLSAKDSDQARKAAMLSSILFFIGPIVWFIPPMATRILVPDIASVFPELNHPEEAAYVAVAFKVLPQGMIGLLIVGMFSATMTSIDSGLNKNSGTFVKNFYIRFIRPGANESQQMIAAKTANVVFGFTIIAVALYYSTLKNVYLFDLMITIGSLIGLPMAIPLVLGLIIKRTPEWSGWSSTVVGLLCSALIRFHFNADWFSQTLDLNFLARDVRYWNIAFPVFVNLTIPTLWFFMTMKFYKTPVDERKKELDIFWANQKTPVVDLTKEGDRQQYRLVGGVSLWYGFFVAGMCLIPNAIDGRIAFFVCGSTLSALGYLLYRKRQVRSPSLEQVDVCLSR